MILLFHHRLNSRGGRAGPWKAVVKRIPPLGCPGFCSQTKGPPRVPHRPDLREDLCSGFTAAKGTDWRRTDISGASRSRRLSSINHSTARISPSTCEERRQTLMTPQESMSSGVSAVPYGGRRHGGGSRWFNWLTIDAFGWHRPAERSLNSGYESSFSSPKKIRTLLPLPPTGTERPHLAK
ncbi:hypothetical protein HPP92_006158 [Vanilla planifolia]|uniref:Uncharacterized protein n=1 Tax=Vanilla planifolia TaxID=51239 RepID=A0A835VDA4_VANPL|nr:hypothetical protein HPP92_006158 [Vanilla planifolia]